jgi:flagellar biogenesis protein FliO
MMYGPRWRNAMQVASLASMFLANPAVAQTLGQGDDTGVSLWRVLVSLLLIALIGAGALVTIKMRTGRLKLWELASDRRLRILEISRITPQSALCLVSLDDHEYMIAVTSGGATLIEKRDARPVGST